MTANASVYDLLGGDRQAMRSVTSSFYQRVLADDMLAPYFTGVDMDRQSVMLAEFLALAFGGPHAYAGRDLRTAHEGLPGLPTSTSTGWSLIWRTRSASTAWPTGTSPPSARWPRPFAHDVLSR